MTMMTVMIMLLDDEFSCKRNEKVTLTISSGELMTSDGLCLKESHSLPRFLRSALSGQFCYHFLQRTFSSLLEWAQLNSLRSSYRPS